MHFGPVRLSLKNKTNANIVFFLIVFVIVLAVAILFTPI